MGYSGAFIEVTEIRGNLVLGPIYFNAEDIWRVAPNGDLHYEHGPPIHVQENYAAVKVLIDAAIPYSVAFIELTETHSGQLIYVNTGHIRMVARSGDIHHPDKLVEVDENYAAVVALLTAALASIDSGQETVVLTAAVGGAWEVDMTTLAYNADAVYLVAIQGLRTRTADVTISDNGAGLVRLTFLEEPFLGDPTDINVVRISI